MFGTYKEKDVTILLKDISGMVQPMSTEDREKAIQEGTPYSEMLPIEYVPTDDYMSTYNEALTNYAQVTADATAIVAEKIWADKGEKAVLVSLARAGISIGVLIKRYLKLKYGKDVAHYAISIIRGVGIDKNAMNYILERHSPESIQFVDGWTGKGAIQTQLDEAMIDFPNVSPGLAVLSDPAHIAEKTGTTDDFLIASSCLNCVVSGLLSRTFLRSDIIKENDFHGAVFYKELIDNDLTYQFIDSVEEHFNFNLEYEKTTDNDGSGLAEAKKICEEFGVGNINFVKPSIGEATRVLLRRVPWLVLVHSLNDDEHLGHLYQLAKEKNVKIIEYPLVNYRACGIIKNLSDV